MEEEEHCIDNLSLAGYSLLCQGGPWLNSATTFGGKVKKERMCSPQEREEIEEASARERLIAEGAGLPCRDVEIWEGVPLCSAVAATKCFPATGVIADEEKDDFRVLSSIVASSDLRGWMLDRFERELCGKKRILSIGAGTGTLEAEAFARGFDVTVIECAPHFVHILMQGGIPASNIHRGDARQMESFGFPLASFDMVLISEAIGSIGLNVLGPVRPYICNGGCIALVDNCDNVEAELQALGARHYIPTKDDVLLAANRFGYSSVLVEECPRFFNDDLLVATGWDRSELDDYPDPETQQTTAVLYMLYC